MSIESIVKWCPNCVDWIDPREGLVKFDGYCATCFKHLFPTDKRATEIPAQSKEMRVRDALAAEFGNKFVHDTPIHTNGCDCPSRRRIDNYTHVNGTILAIEVDENAHRHYNQIDEKVRYDELLTDYGGKMVYIRFNPDPTPEHTADLEDRIKPLIGEIYKQMGRITRGENTDLVEIIYLFYPTPATKQLQQQGSTLVKLSCSVCMKQLANKYNLAYHMRTIHRMDVDGNPLDVDDFECTSDRCNYTSKHETDMKKHQQKCLYIQFDREIASLKEDCEKHFRQQLTSQITQKDQTITRLQVENDMLRQQLVKAYELAEKAFAVRGAENKP